jgi:hypothetical protein
VLHLLTATTILDPTIFVDFCTAVSLLEDSLCSAATATAATHTTGPDIHHWASAVAGPQPLELRSVLVQPSFSCPPPSGHLPHRRLPGYAILKLGRVEAPRRTKRPWPFPNTKVQQHNLYLCFPFQPTSIVLTILVVCTSTVARTMTCPPWSLPTTSQTLH